jgi:hypothetical protein
MARGHHRSAISGRYISSAAAARHPRTSVISYVKLGKFVRLQRSALDAFIESGRVPQEPEVRRL